MVHARGEACLFPVAACPAKGLKSVCRADRRDHFRTTSGLHRHLLARGSAGDWSLSQEYVTHLGAFARPVLHYGYPIARSQLSHYGQYRRDLFTKWVGGTRSTLPCGAPPTGRSCSLKPRLARGASLGGPPPSTAAPHQQSSSPSASRRSSTCSNSNHTNSGSWGPALRSGRAHVLVRVDGLNATFERVLDVQAPDATGSCWRRLLDTRPGRPGPWSPRWREARLGSDPNDVSLPAPGWSRSRAFLKPATTPLNCGRATLHRVGTVTAELPCRR